VRKLKVLVKRFVVHSLNAKKRCGTRYFGTSKGTRSRGSSGLDLESRTRPFARGRPGCVDVSAPTRPRASIHFMPQ